MNVVLHLSPELPLVLRTPLSPCLSVRIFRIHTVSRFSILRIQLWMRYRAVPLCLHCAAGSVRLPLPPHTGDLRLLRRHQTPTDYPLYLLNSNVADVTEDALCPVVARSGRLRHIGGHNKSV